MSIKGRFTRETPSNSLIFGLLILLSATSILSGCSGLVTASNSGTAATLTLANVQAATPTPTAFQVSWSTNLAASSEVDYGTTSSYGLTAPVSSSMVTSHQIGVTSLAPGTLYHFRVRSVAANKDIATSGDMTATTAQDTTPPTVSITAPAANATLSGIVTLSATASDPVVTVSNVQFKVDNANLGAPDASSPYNYSLNTATLSNGNHIITAVATDSVGLTTTSAAVAVKVNNAATTNPGIAGINPSSGVVGTAVTVTGTNFGATKGSSSLTFNGTAATPTSWSAASIVAPVPAGATSGNVVVTVGGVASNGMAFTVTVPAPSISSLNPSGGLVGTSVTISGANFGATQGSSTVKFNGTTATPTSWSASSIVVPVPTGATTGSVVVTVGGVASNGITFTVTAAPVPNVSSLNPTSGMAGTSVTISGSNFGATQGSSTVKFNGTTATPTSWSASSIVAPVPAGATTGNVVVTVGGVASNGVAFTVNVPAPIVTSLSPTTGLVGSSVTISGSNFGATQGSSTVKFNGTTATPTSWSASSIAATVPSGATTGSVVVTVGGAASNGVAFTVQADTTPPTVPTGLTATAISSSQINLSWTASTDNVGVTGYNVYRGGTKIGTSPNTTYQDSGLTASTSYTYNVSAFDAAGNTSAQSAGASATTMAQSSGGGIPSSLGWYQIPSSQIQPLCPTYPEIQAIQGCPAVMADWSGGLFDTKRNRLIINGGGHTAYYGNEIYAIDLNANPIAPVLVHDAAHGSAISNVTSCPDAYTDGTPVSRHTYSGMVYVPSIDKYISYSGSKANCGYFSDALWEYDPAANTWAQISQNGSSQPNPAGNGSTPLLAYDPTTDAVYYSEVNGAHFWQFNVHTNTWTLLQSWGSSPCPTLNTSVDIDVSRRNYVCVGTGMLWKVSLNAPYTMTSLNATNCSGLLSAPGGSPGWAYYPSTTNFVGWAGGNTVYIYNPDTDSCTTQTYTGGPTTIQSLGTYGRFRYSPSLDVFVVANAINDYAYTLRLTAGGGSSSGPNISAISVSGVTTTAATVSWTTDVPATSQVEYGTTTSYGTLTTLNSSLVTSHSVALSGLSVGTVYHYRVHSKNSSGVESISGDAVFSTNSANTTPPSVSITAPASGATVSGTVTISATATDTLGISSVQFTLDGANVGSAITASPYQFSWNTTGVANGSHSISAVAIDTANNQGNATPVTVTVSNSASSALQDFQNRCAQTGVIVCQGFDDPTVFAPAVYPASGVYVGASAAYAAYDPTVSASGSGSLKFTIPSLAGPGDSGYWRQLMQANQAAGPTTATMFKANSTFYVQFRQRFSPEFLTNQWPANGGGTTWWKQEIFSNNNSTCGQVELTTINEYNRGYPMMYSQCGADSFVINLNNGDYLDEQGDTATTGYNCHYQSANNGPNSCFMYPSNTWVTFYYKVSLGNWGQPNSTIQAWVAVSGQPYAEWINIQNHTLNEDVAGEDYDMVTLLPYMTQRNAGVSAGPTAYTWYDELIISSSPIAAPNN